MSSGTSHLLSVFRASLINRVIFVNPTWRKIAGRPFSDIRTASNVRNKTLFTSSSLRCRDFSGCVGSFGGVRPWHQGTGLLNSCPAGYTITKRNKSSKKRHKGSRRKYGSEELEDEEDTDDDDDDVDVELQSGSDFRDMKVKLASLRTDAVIKAGLNMSRNKVEAFFYDSKIRVNGEKLLKKSRELHEGDEVDVERDDPSNNPSLMYVSRVVFLHLGQFDEKKGQFSAVLRRYPKLLIEKPDAWDKGED